MDDHALTTRNLNTLRCRWKKLREVLDFRMSEMLDRMETDFPEEKCPTPRETN